MTQPIPAECLPTGFRRTDSGPVPYRHGWAPFISTKGIACQFFPGKLWMSQATASRMADVYIKAFNIWVGANPSGIPQALEALLHGEFVPSTLADHAALVDEAIKEFLKRRGRSTGPVQPLRKENLRILPAVGVLRTLIDELIAAGDVPEEAKGITGIDVLDACYMRPRKGEAFMPLVMFRKKPEPRSAIGTWLADHKRHPYSDIGLAIAPEGLHISLLSPRDSRQKLTSPKGRWHGRFIDRQDFLGGIKPIRWFLPMDLVLEPGFDETLWCALKGLRVQLRTVALDESLIPHLQRPAQDAAQAFREGFQGRCLKSGILFDRIPTVASERKGCLSFLKGTGPLDDTLLHAVMGYTGLECPRCHATVLVATHLRTGVPAADIAHCDNCQGNRQVGSLLAEKARIQGALWWTKEDGYSVS